MQCAQRNAAENDRILLTGSFLLIGPALRNFELYSRPRIMMERALKERIIGAAVLVLFVVLVVPVFLDGPPGENDIVSETVLLPGQEAQKTQTVVLERNRTEPVPAASAKPEPVVTPPVQAR